MKHMVRRIICLAAVAGLSFGARADMPVLPMGYAQLASLTSTGAQRIDLKEVPDATVSVKMNFNTGTYGNQKAFFGQGWSSSQYLFNEQSNKYMFHGGGTTIGAVIANQDASLEITTDSTDNLTLTIGETAYTNSVSLASAANATMYLFGCSDKNKSATFTLYDFTMWRSGALIHQWVPAKNLSTGKLGIVDLANPMSANAFLPNIDSGADFTPGAYVDCVSVSPIPAQVFIGSEIRPTPKVAFVHEGVSTELPPSAYTLSYANNVNPGRGTVTITGTGEYVFSASVPFSIVKPLLVTAEGAGMKDGSSWANAMDWVKAYGAMADSKSDCEFWLAGDVTISSSEVAGTTKTFQGGVNVTVRGGFRGEETAPSQRDTDSISTVSGGVNASGNGLYNIMDVTLPAGCTLSFERISFAHSKVRAIKKSGAGNIALTGCRLSCNGWGIGHREGAPGCGLYSTGAGTVSVVNTIVDGNGPIHYTQQSTDGGWGIFVTGSTGVMIDNCNFVTNGIWRGDLNGSYQEATKGFALHVVNSKLALSNSRFAGNVSKPGRANNKAGGTIFLEGACGDSRIENCTFIGNLDLAGNEGSGTSGGICIVNMKNATDKLTVCGTTFAYNNTQSTGYGAGGLTVYKGAVTVTDSTFYRNFVGNANARWGTDISILADATLSISNSTLEGLDSRFASCVTPGSLTMDVATMKTDDPMLKTSVLDAESLIIWGQTSLYIENVNPINVKYEATYFKLAAFDATPISPRPVKPDVGEGNVLYVKEDATGADDGSSWANAFTTLEKALAVVSAKKNEIWVAGGLAMSADPTWARIDNPVVVRGGFTGAEDEAAARPAGSKSTIDGANACDLVFISVKADTTVTFENFVFSHAKSHAVNKRGHGDFAFVNCDFLNNGRTQKSSGRAIYSTGEAGCAALSVSNCFFSGQMYDTAAENTGHGAAIYVSNYRRLTVDGSLFVSNGMAMAKQGTNAGGAMGSAIYGYNTPATMRTSRFSGNCNAVKAATGNGGTVALYGFLDGSAFTNCVWSGNYELHRDSNLQSTGGALLLSPSGASHKIDIQSCTFAYNVSQGAASASALNIRSGDVTVNNSIFWKNPHGMTSVVAYGCEIEAAGGTTVVKNSIVTSKDMVYCHGATPTALTLEGTVYTDDPSFVTSNEVFDAMYSGTSYLNPTAEWTYEKAASIDVHLLSPEKYFLNDGTVGPKTETLSAAIDKGDESSDCSHETTPNGGRINIGAYGNTPEGSATPYGVPKGEDFTIDYPNGITRPRVSLKLGLAEGSGYTAKVIINCYQNEALIETKTFDGIPSGNTVEWLVPRCFAEGAADLTFTYEIQVAGVSPATDTKVSSVEGVPPPYAGKGGDPVKIIHVRAGADYKMNGTNWTDAFPDMKSAFDAVTADTEEIWVSEGVAPAELVLTLTQPLVVRGGFAGVENDAASRPAGARTVFDYNNISPGWTMDSSVALTIERFKFYRVKTQAIKKTGAGDLTVLDCQMCCNGQHQLVSGRALYVSGSAGESSVVVSNCVVDGNMTVDSARGESSNHGSAFYVTSCKRLTVDETLFTSNGMQLANTSGMYSYFGYVNGSAVYANATPVTMRRTQFRANMTGNRSSGGGTVMLNGNCSGSAFTNCVFTGNYEKTDASGSVSDYGGALSIALGGTAQTVDIEGCTFAYNVTDANSAAGLTVIKGAVTVKDSIFWHNLRSRNRASYAGDIEVKAGSCSVTYSSVTSKDSSSCRGNAGTTMYLDPDTVYTFDPLFVSSYENDFLACYTVTDSSVSKKSAGTFGALSGFDLHLLSPQGYVLNDGSVGPATNAYSQAIDKGDPDADWSNEPPPNGGHVNIGAYGNTKEASLTSVGQPEVTSFEVLNPNDYARPEAHLRMGIASGSDYAATVTIVCTQGGVEIGRYEQKNVHNGDEVVWLLPRFVDAGAALVYSYKVEADGAETKEASKDVTAGDKYPDYYGKGGGANVIHVRYGADCTPTGDNWTYAYPDLAGGLAAAAERGKGEVWVSTSNFTFTVTAAFTNSVAIRGGFAGTENAAADRVEGAMTTLDNGGTTAGLQLSNDEGTTCTVERLVFSRAQDRAITKTGAGDFIVRNCRFTKNSAGAATDGHAINVAGGSKSTVTFEDSVFDANQRQGGYTESGAGGALCLSNCRTAVVERCLFVSNGIPFHVSGSSNEAYTPGSAIYATGTKLFCRDSRFAANGGANYNSGACGGALFLAGACGGSVVENCAFVGNYDMAQSGQGSGSLCGAICVNLNSTAAEVTIRNCTVAHNISTAKWAPGGLQVNQGTVTVQDSVFWGNVHGYIMTDVEVVQEGKGSPHDIEVRANGRLTLENTLVGGTDFPYVKEASAGLITWRGNVVTNANPLFVTEDATVQAVQTTSGNRIYYTADSAPVLTEINVHLRGGSGYYDEATGELVSAYRMPYESGSPAIDAGRKMRKGLLEPSPNGHRVNLGAYGNTPWATMSKGGTLIFVR